MKKIFYLLFLFTIVLNALAVQANEIKVKGYVKSTNGTAAGKVEVQIAVYLAGTTPCTEKVAVTNADGFYSAELSCTGDIRRARIRVKNCDGQFLVQEKEVPASKVLEVNFTLCVPVQQTCAAKFTAEPAVPTSAIPALSERFNSSGSEVGKEDNITTRTWDFHDGSPLVYNRIDPVHTFPREGKYEVCLTIKTARGCESKVCKEVAVERVSRPACTARFTFEKLGPKKFRFNSNVSILATGDKIIESKWDFRDGTTSNDISPAHEFPKPGNYEVCLVIKTAKGCESRFCIAVKVEEAPPSDHSLVIVSLYPSPVHEVLKTVIYSRSNNTNAIISIVNTNNLNQVVQQVTLSEGNNPFTFDVSKLPAGTYVLRVKAKSGEVSKVFYKG